VSLASIGWTAPAETDAKADPANAERPLAEQPLDVLVVVGAGGAPEYAEAFAEWAERWESICGRADRAMLRVDGSQTDAAAIDQLETALAEAASTTAERPLWIVLIGHGTWDGKTANFNLVGKDVSAKTMKAWLDRIDRPIVLVNCSSSSAPFIDRLSAPRRVIVTATKSGSEKNYARFGDFFSRAIGAAEADIDHDDAVSVREAFLKASADVERFYQEQNRLATEHALLDDNADRKGSDDSLVAGKTNAKDAAEVDGAFAASLSLPVPGNTLRLTDQQIQRRDELEAELKALRAEVTDVETLRERATPVLLQLAELYAEAETAAQE
jgi:hypothetical protein